MTHARRPRRGPSRRCLQVTGRRADQGLDPVRIAGQGGTVQPLTQLTEPGRDPPGGVGPADRDVRLGQRNVEAAAHSSACLAEIP